MTRSVLLPGCRERAINLGEDYDRRKSGLWVPPGPELVPRHVGVGLFAGAGGFDLGFTQAGFHMAAASDGWAIAACTYICNLGGPSTRVHLIGETLPEGRKRETAWHAENRGKTVSAQELFAVCGETVPGPGSGWIANQPDVLPCEHYYLGDIRALTGEQILNNLELTSSDIAAVIGGPPCQGFSRAGKRRVDDPRNELVFEFMRVVIEIKPQTWCMENVPGMLDMVTRDGIPVIDAIALMAEKGGMGTFEALRRSLAETAGVGAALRTKKASGSRMPPGTSGAGHFDADEVEADDDQLAMEFA